MEVSGPQSWSDHFGEEKILLPLPSSVDSKYFKILLPMVSKVIWELGRNEPTQH